MFRSVFFCWRPEEVSPRGIFYAAFFSYLRPDGIASALKGTAGEVFQINEFLQKQTWQTKKLSSQ